ncbi:hypothetical protein BGX34_012172 [Mortierella sp. NVP85]|nr:hypothetical protein BGX34_012172 [Mortierella sp. NVP85]
MEHRASLQPAQPHRNVRLRFFLGPNNLGILRNADEVMERYRVQIYQFDYRFDVYGQPHDVAEAITEGFLQDTRGIPQSSSGDSMAAVSGRHDGPLIVGLNDERPSNPDFNNQFDALSIQDQKAQMATEKSRDPKVIPIYRNQTLVRRRQEPLPVKKWKTDRDLEHDRLLRTYQNPNVPEPEPLVIILSMPEKIAHYLLHRSGGFMSYLVEQPDLESCIRKNMTLEMLESVSESAGMTIAVASDFLPGNEVPVWVQVGDVKALRAILQGVAAALSNEPLRSFEEQCTPNEHHTRRVWDSKLATKDVAKDDSWIISQQPHPHVEQDESWCKNSPNPSTQTAQNGGAPSDPSQAGHNMESNAAERGEQRQYDWNSHNGPDSFSQRMGRHRSDRSRSDNGQRRIAYRSDTFRQNGHDEYGRWDKAAQRRDQRWSELSRSRSASPTPGPSSAASALASSRFLDREAVDEIARASEWASEDILAPRGKAHSSISTFTKFTEPTFDATLSQYYRVKRQNQTIFINTSNPHADTVLALKQRIIKALSSSRNQDGAAVPKTPSDIRLQIPNKKNLSGYLELIDSKTLAASGLVDQQVIAMTLRTADGAWEDVDIAQPEAVEDLEDLEDEPDELEATRREKGKDRA